MNFASDKEKRKRAGLWRSIRVRDGAAFDGTEAVLMASNDYLGLANHPRVVEAAIAAARAYGAGAGASRLITGTLPCHTEFERAIADFKGTDAALMFGSGYAANTGVIPAVAALFGDTGGVILSDEFNHASIIDGCKLAERRARTVTYRHNDISGLAEKAAAHAGRGGLIVTEAVFSMDGDVAPMPEILEIADRYGYLVMIDEAHSTGVLGATGRGIAEHYGCRNPDIIMGTCGKALGSEGGYICGSRELVEYIVNSARSFIFSTAPVPAAAAAATAALRVIKDEPQRIEGLRGNIAALAAALKDYGIEIPPPQSAIIPITIGGAKKAVGISEKLLQRGYFAPAIRFPTVAMGAARLRVTVSYSHTHAQIKGFARALADCINFKET